MNATKPIRVSVLTPKARAVVTRIIESHPGAVTCFGNLPVLGIDKQGEWPQVLVQPWPKLTRQRWMKTITVAVAGPAIVLVPDEIRSLMQ